MSDYYEKTFRPHARLAILRLLEDAPRYTSNVSMMSTLLQSVGITMRRALVEAEVEWLQREGLVEITRPNETLTVVTATVAGVEIAQGIGTHDQIQRPRPGV